MKIRLSDLKPEDYPGGKEMDEKVHRKAYDEGRKSSPNAFNPNFSKHMEKVKQKDINLRKARQQETKITMRSA